MTISNPNNTISYIGSGSQAGFAYDFRVDNAGDMWVYLDGARQVTGWTINGLGDQNGGTVTFYTAPGNGVVIDLRRIVPLTQETNYTPYGAFPAESHELALDKLTMAIQQVNGKVTGEGGVVESIIAGANVTVDSSDPSHPIVSSLGAEGSPTVEWGNIVGTLSDQSDLDNALTAKITTGTYAQATVGGTLKARHDTTNHILYLSNDGSNP